MNIYSLAYYRHDASGYESERAGTSQGIFFSNFIPTVIRACRVVFRDWEIRIHHDERVKETASWPLIERCAKAGMLRLVAMGEAKTLCGSMLWRLTPLGDPDVEWVACRDIDSLPMHRDRLMIEQAMVAGAGVHAILDSESHSGPLMGGMIAVRAKCSEVFKSTPQQGFDLTHHGSDQRWLNALVWPKVKAQTVIHQRRRDIQYPEAMMTLPALPQDTELDKVVRHLGAGYDRQRALSVMKSFYPDPEMDEVEK